MPRSNLILILTDHFRRDALRPDITPGLWRLAGEGTTFANAYSAAPLCQPARACIPTGLTPTHTGICGNQSPPIPADLRDDTFMHHLRAAGYRTALIGKHHYLDRYGIGMDVTGDDEEIRRYGFDHVFQVVDDGENRHNDDEYTRWLADRGKLEAFRACDGWGTGQHPFPADETADGFIGNQGIRYVEEYDEDAPFYLNLSFIGPHPPFWHPEEAQVAPEETTAPVGSEDSPGVRQRRARYLAKCKLIDHYVGRLVRTLETKGMRDNTVILFTSDHGDCLGDFGIWDKRYFYEGSVGVPLFACGPGMPAEERQNGRRISRALVSHLDLYPTVLAAVGLTPPRDPRRPGRDLAAMVGGAAPGQPELPRVVISASPASSVSVTSRTLSTSLITVGSASPAAGWARRAGSLKAGLCDRGGNLFLPAMLAIRRCFAQRRRLLQAMQLDCVEERRQIGDGNSRIDVGLDHQSALRRAEFLDLLLDQVANLGRDTPA